MKASCLVVVLMLTSAATSIGQEKKLPTDETVGQLVPRWEKEVKARMLMDPRLKALAAKYPLVVLPSENQYTKGEIYARSAYSFSRETTNVTDDAQIIFHDYPGPPANFRCFGRDVLVIRIEKTEFEKPIDPGKITIDHPGILTSAYPIDVKEGETYLQRIRDDKGNRFYVVFHVVELDKQSRYMAFIWRMLPGSKRVRVEK